MAIIAMGKKETKSMMESTDRWADYYSDFGGDVGRIYDRDVGRYAFEHLRFIDRFDPKKIASAILLAFCILSKSVEPPEQKSWKFFRDF